MKIDEKNGFRLVGGVGVATLGLVALAFVCPMSGSQAKAENAASDPNAVLVSNNLVVKPAISVALGEMENMEIVPKSTGATGTATTDLVVTTNSDNGFKILVNGMDSTAMRPAVNDQGDKQIESIANAATLQDFTNNAWGYSLAATGPSEATTYWPVSLEAQEALADTSTAGVDKTYKLSFGVKVDTKLPAGTYRGTVLVSAIANPVTVNNLLQIEYMQQMTKDICANTKGAADDASYKAHPITKKLIDTRDGKSYWVAKLADGNCWMTQNLDYDIVAGKTLTDSDTDLATGTEWTPEHDTLRTPLEAAMDGAGQRSTYSINPGEMVLATPIWGKDCGVTADLEACRKVGFVNVENWSPSYTAQQGQFATGVPEETDEDGTVTGGGTYTGLVSVNELAKTYDSHYHVGNYYQYNTATAGTASNQSDGYRAPSTICPKGWTIPVTGLSLSYLGTSVYRPLNAYGLASSPVGTGENAQYNVAAAPLYYVQGGSLSYTNNMFSGAGRTGRYLNNSSTTANNTYSLVFTQESLTVSSVASWHSFLSVRCVAK